MLDGHGMEITVLAPYFLCRQSRVSMVAGSLLSWLGGVGAFLLCGACGTGAQAGADRPAQPQASSPFSVYAAWVEHEGHSFSLSEDNRLTPPSELVKELSSFAETASVEIEIFSDTPSRNLFVFLLGASQANLESAFMLLPSARMEVAVPNADRVPAFSVADVYLAVEAEGVRLTHSLSELTQPASSYTAADDLAGLAELLRIGCADSSCTHAVLQVPPLLTMQEIYPLLLALDTQRSSAGTLRLVLSEQEKLAAPSQRALSQAQLSETVARHAEAMKECQQMALARDVPALGTIHVLFEVTPLGIVFEASPDVAGSTIQDPELLNCVVEKFRKMKFPSFTAGDPHLEFLVRLQ